MYGNKIIQRRSHVSSRNEKTSYMLMTLQLIFMAALSICSRL